MSQSTSHADRAYQQAKIRIERARRSGRPSLNLNDFGLQEVPAEIGTLTNLRRLDLSDNELRDLPPQIADLKNLRSLDLSRNEFFTLPRGVTELTELTHLYAYSNHLESIPKEIGRLNKLRELLLHDNRIVKLPDEIGRLQDLQGLALLSNRLSELPTTMRALGRLDSLYLHDNPALELSPTALGRDPRKGGPSRIRISPRSILDFYFGRKVGETRPLNEVKLILVGRGGAGKTSTVQTLKNLPFRESEESTPGIALSDWVMKDCRGRPVTAHIWDFAGQVITHALHQFFFSIRSVYVVVLTGRENSERDDAEYWLRLIKAFGTDDHGNGPPVIIALNKWDVAGCRPRLDRGALRERYPFIRCFVEMDCKSKKGIPKLKAALCREVDRLEWVREPFPKTWDSVRRALATGRKKRAHLTYAEFRQLCVRHGVFAESEQDSLSDILHNLGAALNYRNDPRLREATVLQPEWLTRNVYALMRRAEKNAGVLTQGDIDSVLWRERNAAMRSYLIQIMERFEIAYASRSSSAGVWLIPQALPDQQPSNVASFRDIDDSTRLRYTYQALPEGLVARAIVRLHEFIEEIDGRRQQWASGAILLRKGARALIRTEPQDRQVSITVAGPRRFRQQLAGLCQSEMRDIHSEIPGLDPVEETRVRGEWIATATLEVDERRGRSTGISTKDRGTIMVDPTEPNNAYTKKAARSNLLWKPSIFISYSKSNLIQRKRLESELKVLKNEGLLARDWHDRMIDPGDDWDAAIQKELGEADVIILLASSAALATEYITANEIPTALALHHAGETVVVPLILEKCRWDKTPLGALAALPEKAKPINNWKPQSDGWGSVADGLAKVLRRLIDRKHERGGGLSSSKKISYSRIITSLKIN
jgi:internalin A